MVNDVRKLSCTCSESHVISYHFDEVRFIGNRKKRDLEIDASPTITIGTYMITRMTAM